ncbi:hypothetical protein GGI20_003656 [Coemansia sp. BCRC 34301]|nr:hypothetical protein GGI20_003656 [Coemansia sp. BCRC 34301]
MASKIDQQVLSQAIALYNQAIQDTPPNRTIFDNLVDLVHEKPLLLYNSFFDKGYEAANSVIDVWHGGPEAQEDDNLSFLTPPAAWGWATMEEAACQVPPEVLFDTEYPTFVRRFLELASKTLQHSDSTPAPIVRRVIQALTRFWPELIRICINSNPDNSVWRERYLEMVELDKRIQQLASTLDDPALGVHLVKHQEMAVAMFTVMPNSGAGDGNSDGLVNLSRVPDSHAYIDKAALASRAASARQQLVRLLPNSENLCLCNMSFITALLNSMFYLMVLRPQLCEELLGKLVEWYGIINSSEQGMTHAQLVMIGKTVRISLLHLYAHLGTSQYSELLETELDNIGGAEWEAYRDRRAKQEKKEQKEREHKERNKSRPGESGGMKRRPRESDDNDEEENQSRMLEENAKRVKLDEADSIAASAAAAAAKEAALQVEIQTAQLAAGTETDMELEEQLKTTMPESAFVMQPMDALTPDARDALFVEALKRVVSAGSVVDKFIARNRLQALGASTSQPPPQPSSAGSGEANEFGAPAALPNGISTNAGIMEDSMLMLVRLICNCYIMSKDIADNGGAVVPGSEPSHKWTEVNACAEAVLKSIVEAPRERYGLAILMLYEIWMAVVISDPQSSSSHTKQDRKGQEPCSALKLYLHWCDRIFDAIIQCGMDATLSQKAAATAAAAAAAAESASAAASGAPGTTLQQQPTLPQQLQQPDRLILNFVLDAPHIESTAIKKLEACLNHADTAMLGYATLEKAMELRPPVVKAGMDLLLTYSGNRERATRIGCIRAVKKYYTTSAYSPMIEKWAQLMLKTSIDNAIVMSKKVEADAEKVLQRPVEPLEPGVSKEKIPAADERAIEARKAEVLQVHRKGDQEIEACLVAHAELLLALCTRNMDLYVDVLNAYASVPPPVQSVLRRVVTPLVKSVSAAPAKIVPALTKFPSGAESLVLRTIFILSAEGSQVPARELVQGVTEMCDARGLDARFLVFIANGLTKEEALGRLGSVLMLLNGREAQWPLVSEFYARLTTPYASSPSLLSPMELLLALHRIASEEGTVPMSKIFEGLAVYSDMRRPDGTPVFSTQVFVAALKVLIDEPVVSPVMLHTAEIYHRKRGGPAGTVVNLLQKLIERDVWEMPAPVFESFVRCFFAMQPGSLGLIKHIPSDALKKVVSVLPAFEPLVRNYVSGMNESFREKFSWLVVSDNKEAPQE